MEGFITQTLALEVCHLGLLWLDWSMNITRAKCHFWLKHNFV